MRSFLQYIGIIISVTYRLGHCTLWEARTEFMYLAGVHTKRTASFCCVDPFGLSEHSLDLYLPMLLLIYSCNKFNLLASLFPIIKPENVCLVCSNGCRLFFDFQLSVSESKLP